MSIDLLNWSSNLDSELMRKHVRATNEIHDYLFRNCDGDIVRWNAMTNQQRVNLGLHVWRLVVRVCCRPRRTFQLYLLTRLLKKLVPDDVMLMGGSGVVKLTYVMRYTFYVSGGMGELVRCVGYEALYDYCIDDPLDTCELGDFVDLLASFHPESTFLLIVSVYVQVPVSDSVLRYFDKNRLKIDGVDYYEKVRHHHDDLEVTLVPHNHFFEDVIMRYNLRLYNRCLIDRTVYTIELTCNFNALQLLYELAYLVKEYRLLRTSKVVYQHVMTRNLWYVRLLLMNVETDCGANAMIDMLTRIKAPIFSPRQSTPVNVDMLRVVNYLK
ncbi:ORF105 [Betabaculovirus altermyunipunctae]|uniref:ORF105 n=1 Tax=Betabaculovirus altermyunipunctae TaxID=3051996 RepID=A0A1S5YE10_9BBAC|nr:ORF105 [Betabaculovirus altermyunipunctae]AQQ80372.1 ORF105 [Betabaculovirus altermyunipunctae]